MYVCVLIVCVCVFARLFDCRFACACGVVCVRVLCVLFVYDGWCVFVC